MKLVQVELSEELVEAAQLNRSNPFADAARLLALDRRALKRFQQ